jgi:HlyD family secretion protein
VKRRSPIPLLLLVCAACSKATEEREEPVAVEVHCTPVTAQSIEQVAILRGRVAAPPGGDLPVASQVAGRVIQVLVHEGDHVATGAVVAQIDGSNSRDALRQADAAVVQAESAETNAKATLERVQQLVTRGIAAKQELDDAVARTDQAHAAVNAAIAAADLARRVLGRVEVRSSFDGVVTRVWRGAGALVDGTATTPIVQLAASALAEFDADATENQLVDIEPGQAVTISLATGGEPVAGTVRARSTALDPATGIGFVRIAIQDARPMTLGVFGAAKITLGERKGVLVVPSAAMRGAIADGAEVVVCKDGKAEVRKVKAGWRDDERVEIAGGLAAGERVAVDRVLGLETDSPIVEAK